MDRSILADPSFVASLDAFGQRVALLGALNSLTQLALKAAMPGVSDFYQGTEFWDLSLVDPDNRRPVDFGARVRVLDGLGETPDWHALASSWQDGRIKLALRSGCFAWRCARRGVAGRHRPLRRGRHRDHVIALPACTAATRRS
jgi:(1->4)-alpha-D-glucan 1-alpha-D-glucosylmutase